VNKEVKTTVSKTDGFVTVSSPTMADSPAPRAVRIVTIVLMIVFVATVYDTLRHATVRRQSARPDGHQLSRVAGSRSRKERMTAGKNGVLDLTARSTLLKSRPAGRVGDRLDVPQIED